MATIPKSGIATSNTIEASHVTNIIDALDGTTSREIRIPGSTEITGSLKTNSTNTFTGELIVNNTLNLSQTNSAITTKLIELNNSSAVSVNLLDYPYGSTFEIDLGQDSANDVSIRLQECPTDNFKIEYEFQFSRDANASGATLVLANSGGQGVEVLNCNTNAKATITNDTGAATTATTDLIYTRVRLTNVRYSAGTAFWFMQIWSDQSTAFTIT